MNNNFVECCLTPICTMERLKKRKEKAQSRNKIITAINLYEQYVDEKIDTIKIQSSTEYFINYKWLVDISTNKVNIIYPDPDIS